MKVEVPIVNAFVDENVGGNPAGVVLNAQQYSQAHQLRSIDSLGLKPSDLLADARPCVVNTGNSFLIIALRSSEIVKSINPIKELISEISEIYDLIGFYAFSPETVKEGRDAGARMFAPRYGIDEESATGMAAGPLTCYLHDELKNEKREYLIEQGQLMSPAFPSVITVKLIVKAGAISSLMAGGKAAVSEFIYVEI